MKPTSTTTSSKAASKSENSASSILRRLLRLSAPHNETVPQPASVSDLEHHISSLNFMFAKGVVGKFLSILEWLYKRHGSDFSQIESIKGRGRIYFSTDLKTLENSGRSVNPKKIPGSSYWVITTTPTILKQEILAAALKMFKYSASDIQKANNAIAK